MPELKRIEISLIKDALSNYVDLLDEKEEFIEELKDHVHVTQELDELIFDIRRTKKMVSELLYKI